MKLHEELKDGIYHVTYYDRDDFIYRAEKINGVWYSADGTGWQEKLEYPESIVSAKEVSHLPTL